MPQNINQRSRLLRVVLFTLNSRYIHSTLAPWCLKAGLAAFAQIPHEGLVVEGTVNEPMDKVQRRLVAAAPDVLGISCYIWNILEISRLLPQLRAALPDCVVVMGGPEVGHRAENALNQYPEADYILAGEGEMPFAQLVDAVSGLRPLETVPGLCRRLDGKSIIKEPYVHGGPALSPYCPAYFEQLKGRIAYLETSRGCPYDCAFCLSGRREALRFLPLEQAFEEILRLAGSGAKTIKFVDRTFNADRKRALDVLRFIADAWGKEIPEGVTFHFEIAGDLLDGETLDLIAGSPKGLFQFEIGLQSMREETLLNVRRKTDMARLLRNVSRLIASGTAHVHLDLIAGLPGEGLDAFAPGLDIAHALHPQTLQLGFLKLLHGSAMRDNPARYPCVFSPMPPYEALETPDMSREDFALLHQTELALDKLHNSGRFIKTLRFLTEGCGISPFSLYLKLYGTVKEGQSLDETTNLLYDFLSGWLPDESARIHDCLLHDRLATTLTSVLPACLKQEGAPYHQAKRALNRIIPKEGGAVRAFGFLRSGEVKALLYCDHAKKDPVTGQYEVFEMPLAGLGL